MATAPGEKLLMGRRPVRKLDPLTISSLFLRKCVLKKMNKNCWHLSCTFLTLSPICTKSFVGWGFAPDPTGGAYGASPDPLAVFRGLTFKGREGEGKGGARRIREGREGETHHVYIAPKSKIESRALYARGKIEGVIEIDRRDCTTAALSVVRRRRNSPLVVDRRARPPAVLRPRLRVIGFPAARHGADDVMRRDLTSSTICDVILLASRGPPTTPLRAITTRPTYWRSSCRCLVRIVFIQ